MSIDPKKTKPQDPQDPSLEQPKPKILAYVDILGFKERILRNDLQQPLRALGFVAGTAKVERLRKEFFKKEELLFGRTVQTSTFSDTIVMSCDPVAGDAHWLLGFVQMVCMGLLVEGGHYTRGAITLGTLIHHPAAIVGQALVEAHLLEREVAKYPRVVVTDAAMEFFEATPRPNKLSSQIRIDFDGLRFLDIFGYSSEGKRFPTARKDASRAKATVEHDLGHTRDPIAYSDQIRALNHRMKYVWMLTYLETVIADPVDPTAPE
jgi:hypothetical protein